MKPSVILCSIMLLAIVCAKAAVVLTAHPDAARSVISLRWNMEDHYKQTAYVLLKSFDGVVWQIAAANPVYRNYSSNVTMAFNDRVSAEKKILYKVKIYDPDDKIVAMSGIVETALSATGIKISKKASSSASTMSVVTKAVGNTISSNNWKIFTNAQPDFLYLTYRGATKIKGVINVLVSDAKGKIRVRYRQASNNPDLKIPISNLQKGMHKLQVIIQDEVHLQQQFVRR